MGCLGVQNKLYQRQIKVKDPYRTVHPIFKGPLLRYLLKKHDQNEPKMYE